MWERNDMTDNVVINGKKDAELPPDLTGQGSLPDRSKMDMTRRQTDIYKNVCGQMGELMAENEDPEVIAPALVDIAGSLLLYGGLSEAQARAVLIALVATVNLNNPNIPTRKLSVDEWWARMSAQQYRGDRHK
jgi:hypothetical protein